MKICVTFFILMSLSVTAFSEPGDFGVETDVTTTGLFPPKLETVTVATVKDGSTAAKAGIKQGDKVVSIGGCAIPGCSAFKAQKMMHKEKGESLTFGVISEGGALKDYELIAE